MKCECCVIASTLNTTEREKLILNSFKINSAICHILEVVLKRYKKQKLDYQLIFIDKK